ncbi:MAG: SDR family oxidoreductase [Myxococcales bacterium]
MTDSLVPTRPCAVVTGASGGIGLDLARLLAADGHDLVLVARSAGKLQEIGKELTERFKVRCEAIPADLSKLEGVEAVVAGLAAQGLKPDVLVNNAGFGQSGEFAKADLARLLEMIQLNVVSLTALTGRLLPGMIERKRGRILNVASTAAFQPAPMLAVYSATKAYVLSFSEALSAEVAGSGVTVTTLCPGATVTGFAAAAEMTESALFKKMPTMQSDVVARLGYRAMLSGRRTIVTGFWNKLGALAAQLAPRGLVIRMAQSLQVKAG